MEQVEVKRPRGPGFKLRVFKAEAPLASAPTLLMQPAMGVRAAFYDVFGTALAAQGLNTIVSELRGNGDSGVIAGRGSDFGYWDMISEDWPPAIAYAEHRFGNPVALMGHSLGGQLNMLYAALHPDRVSRLILIAASSVHYKVWPEGQRLGMLGFTQSASLTAKMLGYFPGHRFKFAGREARTVIRDWAHQSRTGRYEPLNCPHDCEAALKQLDLPVLVISVDGDRLAPPSTVKGLADKMPNARPTFWHFEPSSHGMSGIDHFRWAKQPTPVVERIFSWLGGSD